MPPIISPTIIKLSLFSIVVTYSVRLPSNVTLKYQINSHIKNLPGEFYSTLNFITSKGVGYLRTVIVGATDFQHFIFHPN